jgi:GMP synthase (glutamine-hydrolysing)
MSLNILIIEGNNSDDSSIFVKAVGSTAADNLKNLVLKLEPNSNTKIINPAKDDETKKALENINQYPGNNNTW